jgi:phosphate-selective porin
MLDATRQPAVLDAYLDFSRDRLLPEPFAFRLRAGQFKVPFSMENLVPDTDMETINRSQVVEALVPGRDTGTKGRDTGSALQITASPWGRKKLIEVTAGLFNGEGANAADKNKHKGFAARAALNPSERFSFGGSYYDGNRFSTSTVQDRLGAEALIRSGTAYLAGEYIIARDGGVRREGWYAQAAFYPLPKVLQAVIKYDIYDPDVKKSNADSTASELKTAVTTLAVNWYFQEGLRLQSDYEWKYRTDGGILCGTFNTMLALSF